MTDIVEQVGNQGFRIIFEMGEDPLIYRDALFLSLEDYESISEAELTAMKEERYNAWLEIINTTPEE